MSNQKTENQKDKNLLYIGIFTVALIIVIIAVFLITSNNDNSNSNVSVNNANAPQAAAVSIVNEEGNQEETIEKKIEIRKIDFSKKINAIKKFEKKQEDTLDNPTEASSEDGYTYLTYKFNPEKPANFFGSQVSAADPNAMLVYVFHNENLIEVRIQYGAIGSTAYDTIVSANNSSFGAATYSRTYSNGTKESWWKTKDTTLDLIYQENSVIAYYRINNR